MIDRWPEGRVVNPKVTSILPIDAEITSVSLMTREETAGRLIGVAKRFIPPPGRWIAARFLDVTTDSLERIMGRGGPLTPPLRIRLHVGPFLDPELYRLSAERNVEALRELCGLRRDSRILDIGCGCGRVASALARYISSTGSYDGFDVAKEAVEWCQRHISARFPNFDFVEFLSLSSGIVRRACEVPPRLHFLTMIMDSISYLRRLSSRISRLMDWRTTPPKPGGSSVQAGSAWRRSVY